ncbi:MAG: protein kinase [Planctomycetota bacterium]
MQSCEHCGTPLGIEGDCQICLLQLGISSSEPEAMQTPDFQSVLPDAAELNQQFPQLEITKLVGRGGMGAVYHARQTNLDRDVALKVIDSNVARDSAFLERFEREAKTLARLSHPNIVTVYDYGQTESGLAYLVMEFIDGINLREAILSRSAGPEDSLEIVATICDALQYAHGRGVVHRDIKPENILLGENGEVKVADFGIAKIVDNSIRTPTLTATRQVLGSVHYLAPEHLEAPGEVDHRVDLYALGVIFYELLTGQLPLGRYEPPSALQPQASGSIDEVVMKALNRKPSQRFQEASEMQAALSSIELDTAAAIPMAKLETSAPGVEADLGTGKLSVPFKCEGDSGMSEAVGMIHLLDDNLKLEFRINGMFTQSKTKKVEIAADEISRVEYNENWLGGKIELLAHSIEAFGEMPNAETGKVTLSIANADKAFAARLIRRFCASRPEIRGESLLDTKQPASVSNETSGNWVTFGVLMIFCAIVNAGALAVGEYLTTVEIPTDTPRIAVTIILAVTIGPIALIQLATGLSSLIAQPRNLARACTAVSLVPTGPAWLISLPTAIWFWSWFRKDSAMEKVRKEIEKQTEAPKSWGATTMTFIRDNRWGRTIAISNFVGAFVGIFALIIITSGKYDEKLNYRVVDRTAVNITDAIRQRLSQLDGVNITEVGQGYPEPGYAYAKTEPLVPTNPTDSPMTSLMEAQGYTEPQKPAPERLVIKVLKRDVHTAQTLLQIKGPVKLGWVIGEDVLQDGTSSQVALPIDVDADLKMPTDYLVEGDFGKAARVLGQTTIESNMFSKIEAPFSDIEIHLTKDARELMASTRPDVQDKAKLAIALITDDTIIGYAELKDSGGRKLTFKAATGFERSSSALIAAIRGPVIDSDLELLK